jgi:hypothetical protein
MNATDHPAEDALWAITCYFNPARYRRRLANYRAFRQHLRVPLVAVELSFGGPFDLGPADAEVLVQLRGSDVMWQKERLLNLAVAAVPGKARNVVWLDCDTIFSSEEWPEQVVKALDVYPLVQPFDRAYRLGRAARLEAPCDPAAAESEQQSIPVAIQAGRSASACLNDLRGQTTGGCVMGIGWAMRRELLEQIGLYDACIVGGGTRAFIAAAYGCFDETPRFHLMNPRQRDHYLAWASRLFQAVRGQVTAARADLFHLWHGALADRRYKERYEGLQPFGFDPHADLALDANGVWRWNSDKPAMHRYVRDYFAARKEDG